MLDDSTPTSGSQDETPDTTPAERPRRRRAASRPAGPPKEVEAADVQVPVTQAAGTASVVSTSAAGAPSAASADAPASADVPTDAEAAPAAPKRRRATRKAAAPDPVPAPEQVPSTTSAAQAGAEQVTTEQASTEPATTEQTSSEQSTAAQSTTEQAETVAEERPTRARRTRSRKSAPAAEAPQAPAVDDVQTGEQDAPADEPVAQDTTDRAGDVDAALAAASAAAAQRPRRGRKVAKQVANPFVSPQLGEQDGEVDAQSVLDQLAASIAAGDQPARVDEPVVAQDAVELDEDAEDAEDADAAETDEDQDTESDAEDQDTADTEDADADADDSEDSDGEDSGDEGGARRRRRRRGGRRRRRSGEGSDAEQDSDEEQSEGRSRRANHEASTEDSAGDDSHDDHSQPAASEDADEADSSAEDDADGSEGGRRRRRRRRRRGEDTAGAEDDPGEVVVRVREPRRIRTAAQANDEVTGIDGSTRMEAKRQRRREGRAAGRRRAPILSEAEFLARRESVTRRMVIRQNDDYTQLAVLEDDILVEHYVDRASATSLIGNVYLGRVQNVLPSMEAAFIDIGRGRNAVLYAGEIDWDAFGAAGQQKKVEQVLKSGQTVLVQVSKDPVGAKGARLTSHISLPGRYVVYSPGGHLSGISRKLADAERHRLKDILGDLIDDKASVIVRTAAEGASEDELVRDVNRLKAQWVIIEKKAKQGSAPQQLYAEPDLTVRIVRDLFTEDFTELVVSGNGGPEDAYESINGYVTHVAPHLAERLTHWDAESQGDPFAKHKIDEQIAKALERKVFLPSGGSLVIDRTEAMTVIDVNTGKFTGTGGNLEATVTSNNLEAAEEIVRQLRLRDIGGIIVVDFIDMVLPNNRELLLRRLVECLGRDRTRHQVAEVTSLGLVQMTRKKIGTGLAEAFTEECEGCGGRGYIRHDSPVETQAQADGGERHHGGGGRRGGHRH